MARINIDDSLFSYPPFKRLRKKVGDEDLAVGMTYRLWRLAQIYWGNGEFLIPLEELQAEGLEVMLEIGMAVQRETGIYAKGSKEAYSWILERKDTAKKGGEARKNAPRDTGGRFRSGKGALPADDQPGTSSPPADDQLDTSRTPAENQPATSQIQRSSLLCSSLLNSSLLSSSLQNSTHSPQNSVGAQDGEPPDVDSLTLAGQRALIAKRHSLGLKVEQPLERASFGT